MKTKETSADEARHKAEAQEILAQGEAYALGYIIGLLEDFVNGDAFDRRWATARSRPIIAEWCEKHPTSMTARKRRGEVI